MNDCRNRLTAWFVVSMLILAVQILSAPVGFSLSVRISPIALSLLLLVALQGCSVNWLCIRQADEEIKNKLEFIKLLSKLVLIAALAAITVIDIAAVGLAKSRYLTAEVGVLVSALFAAMVLSPESGHAHTLSKERDKYSKCANAVYKALFLNCFIALIPFFFLSLQYVPVTRGVLRYF